ncbi:flagellar export chaperone FliS [Thalassobacillus pellis]|uniref:flagellar export chaperone FliS n=1 Tax=Thalassobacillus pellis TaxID=748008 RepID=UPI00195FA066|nr:flagellar export chaperone FliS [Thalassobacillus pellis]MBM7551427.1 flagellar protein FliS [Thalassobacillus pellis]
MSIQAYQNNSVETASPGELTLMLYNGCLKFIKLAKKAVDNEDFEAKNRNIQKAQNIIRELMITIDPNASVSQEILPIYEFINHRLMDANIYNDARMLGEALELVTEFRDTWKEVLRQTRQLQHGQGGNA